MITWLQGVFGSYEPITYTENGVDIIPSGWAGVNWEYVAGVAVFLVVTICLFKLIGSFIKGR